MAKKDDEQNPILRMLAHLNTVETTHQKLNNMRDVIRGKAEVDQLPRLIDAARNHPHLTNEDFMQTMSVFVQARSNLGELTSTLNFHAAALVYAELALHCTTEAGFSSAAIDEVEEMMPGSSSAVASVQLPPSKP